LFCSGGTSQRIFTSTKLSRKRAMCSIKNTPSGSEWIKQKPVDFESELSYLDAMERESIVHQLSDDEEQSTRLGSTMIKKEYSASSKALCMMVNNEKGSEEAVTVPRKKQRVEQKYFLMKSMEKNDEMLEVIMKSIQDDSSNQSTVKSSSKYSDITDRIENMLDSLPQNVRYRAIGAIYNSLNEKRILMCFPSMAPKAGQS
ncbi:hypothetical protein PENTCL1PPCAC_16597, partial [Pristionchus entomophagus]